MEFTAPGNFIALRRIQYTWIAVSGFRYSPRPRWELGDRAYPLPTVAYDIPNIRSHRAVGPNLSTGQGAG